MRWWDLGNDLGRNSTGSSICTASITAPWRRWSFTLLTVEMGPAICAPPTSLLRNGGTSTTTPSGRPASRPVSTCRALRPSCRTSCNLHKTRQDRDEAVRLVLDHRCGAITTAVVTLHAVVSLRGSRRRKVTVHGHSRQSCWNLPLMRNSSGIIEPIIVAGCFPKSKQWTSAYSTRCRPIDAVCGVGYDARYQV